MAGSGGWGGGRSGGIVCGFPASRIWPSLGASGQTKAVVSGFDAPQAGAINPHTVAANRNALIVVDGQVSGSGFSGTGPTDCEMPDATRRLAVA